MIEITSQQCQVFGVGDSQQGGRPENQDDFDCTHTPLGFLVVLCDGMGGGPGGKTASFLAKTAFMQALASCSPTASPNAAIRMAVNAAEETLELRMNENPSLMGMGSTLAAILFASKSAYVVHLGDSRVYQLRGKKMVFRTKDHSLVQELQERNALTEEQARTSPQSNVIMRGLGNTTNHVAEIEEIKYKQDDRFVLCSDGVWGCMPHSDLLARFTQRSPMSQLVADIQSEVDHIGYASGGGHDNHTLIMIEAHGKTQSEQLLKLSSLSRQTLFIILLALLLCVSVIVNVVLCANFKSKEFASEDYERYIEGQIDHLRDQQLTQEVLVDILSQNNDSLTMLNLQLMLKVDALEAELASLPQSQLQNVTKKEVVLATNPQVLLDSALILLTRMQRNYDQDQETIIKANRNRHKEVIQLLNLFVKRTTPLYDEQVQAVVQGLTDDEEKMLKTRRTYRDRKYTASMGASNIIYKYKKLVDKILSQYKYRDSSPQ